MIHSKITALALGLTLVFPAIPALAAWQCSVHPPKGASDARLMSMARIPKARAEQTALERFGRRAKVSSAELEAERGCLIWSFDVKVHGRSGVQEVNVDAGNGKVLEVHHETPGQEASEGSG